MSMGTAPLCNGQVTHSIQHKSAIGKQTVRLQRAPSNCSPILPLKSNESMHCNHLTRGMASAAKGVSNFVAQVPKVAAIFLIPSLFAQPVGALTLGDLLPENHPVLRGHDELLFIVGSFFIMASIGITVFCCLIHCNRVGNCINRRADEQQGNNTNHTRTDEMRLPLRQSNAEEDVHYLSYIY